MRRADSSIRDSVIRPGPDELDEQLRQRFAAELVAARLDDLREPVGGVELFHSPRLRQPDRAVRHGRVADERPVRADDAVEAVTAAQHVGDHALVEAEADGLELGAERPAVVRHDLRRSGGEGRLERPQVILEAAARVHLILAVREVRDPRRRPAGRRRGNASSCTRRCRGRARRPGSRGCTPRSSGRRDRSPRRRCRRCAPSAARWQRPPSGAAPRGCRWRGTPAWRSRRSSGQAPRRGWRRARSAPATATASRRPSSSPGSRRTRGADRTRWSPECRAASIRPAAAGGCAIRPSVAHRASRRR